MHFEHAYKPARHYIRLERQRRRRHMPNVHLQGRGSPLVRAAVAAGVDVHLAATYPGTCYFERRLKRWHKTGQFCVICRERCGRAR